MTRMYCPFGTLESLKLPLASVVGCGDGNGVGQPSLFGVIAVAGEGVGPHGAHGMSETGTPASGFPSASSTTTPEAFVVFDGGCVCVGEALGVPPEGTGPPAPPPPHAANANAPNAKSTGMYRFTASSSVRQVPTQPDW